MNNSDLSIDQKITIALEKLSGALNYILRNAAELKGLSALQLQFLDFLGRFPDDVKTVSAIAREFNLTKGTVSEAVKTLETKGLVKKIYGGEDGRTHIIRPTQEGITAASGSIRVRGVLAEIISSIKTESKDVIYSFLVEIISSLSAGEHLPYARICFNCENRFERSDGSFECRITGNILEGPSIELTCAVFSQGG